jgi:outer membrane protein assembly factor BamE (lipoprotein component of BamABCDE complex)
MKRLLPTLAVLALSLTSSCFLQRDRVNQRLEPARYEGLVPGMSTADDVLLALGAPMDVVQIGRRSAWRYDYTESKRAALFLVVVALSHRDTMQDRVWAFFDEEGVLTHIGATLEGGDAEYKLPWND